MKKPNKKQVGIGLITILVILGSLLLFVYVTTQKEPAKQNTYLPCRESKQSDIVADASRAFDLENEDAYEDISAVGDKVLSFEGYAQDEYCLQILTMRYIRESDHENSNKYLTLLNELTAQSGVEPLGMEHNFIPVKDMEAIVEGLEKQSERYKSNNIYDQESRIHEKVQ